MTTTTTLTLEERLARLEYLVDAIRTRLGMVEDDKVPQGSAGVMLRPDQVPDPAAARVFDIMTKVQLAQNTPPLSPAEVCRKYENEPRLLAHFTQIVRLTDSDDFTTILVPPGWHRLPRRLEAQLRGMAEVVPESV